MVMAASTLVNTVTQYQLMSAVWQPPFAGAKQGPSCWLLIHQANSAKKKDAAKPTDLSGSKGQLIWQKWPAFFLSVFRPA